MENNENKLFFLMKRLSVLGDKFPEIAMRLLQRLELEARESNFEDSLQGKIEFEKKAEEFCMYSELLYHMALFCEEVFINSKDVDLSETNFVGTKNGFSN